MPEAKLNTCISSGGVKTKFLEGEEVKIRLGMNFKVNSSAMNSN